MSYSVNGKVYTSHPLMDEIVYNCKTILNGIVLKNEKRANEFETADSLSESDAFLAIMNGSIHLEILPITERFLKEHGFSTYDSVQMSRDYSLLPQYVECVVGRYNENNTAPVRWNYRLARFEYESGKVAGRNLHKAVTIDNGKFIYADGTECSEIVIPYLEDYYTDTNGNIIVPDDPDDIENTIFRNLLTGEISHGKAIPCIAGIMREFANDYYYDEQNLYYRTLEGMPAYGTTEYDVYVDEEKYGYLLAMDTSTEFNLSLPIHEFTLEQINSLITLGILDGIIEEYYTNAESNNKPYYKYLNYLGVKKIDLYQARFAKDWDILYMPTVEHIVSDNFKEKFKINRDIYYRRTYQQAYSLYSEYYEEMIMILILCQTFTDMVTDTPEFYIRRDIFDLRSVQYFLEANGVEFYKEIPLKYQILIVKNLNKLIKYKSTERNINDILSIFSKEDAIVYKYYLFKKYLYNKFEKEYQEEGEEVDSTNWEDSGALENGHFTTKDLSGWTVETDIPEYSDTEENLTHDYGYIVRTDKFSSQNRTPYLYIWNNTDEEQYFSMKQTIPSLHDGRYRFQYRYAGTSGLSLGLMVYLDGRLIMPSVICSGDGMNVWKYANSEEFDASTNDPIELKIAGNIPVGFYGRIDELALQIYTDICDCGDEDEGIDEETIEIIDENTPGIEILDFWDESSSGENYLKNYIYDFGNEDSGIIDIGDVSDRELNYDESTRIIYDESGNVYELEFIKVPLGDSYDDYIKDDIYRLDYDSVTEQDKYWDGENVHNYIKNQHLAKDFTIEGSKFMTLEFDIPYQEYSYQRQYYIGLLLNTSIDTQDLRISVPSIQQNATFTLQNLFLFIYCCNGIFDNDERIISDPTDKFNRIYDKPAFEPFEIIDGGHAWDGENIPEEEEEEDDFPPDLDFGDEDLPASRRDPSRTEIDELWDFGYNAVINYSSPDLVVYDYREILSTDIMDPEAYENEENEPPLWPIQDLADYGDDDLYRDEEDSIAVIRTPYTLDNDYGDEDDPSYTAPDFFGNPLVYDYAGQTAGSVEEISMAGFNGRMYEFGDEDTPSRRLTASSEFNYTELYDFGFESPTISNTSMSSYIFDFGFDDEDDRIDEEFSDFYDPYYIQNSDLRLLKLYEFDSDVEAYVMMYNYSTTETPADLYTYDIKITLDSRNYKTYLRHYVVNRLDGTLTVLTMDNYEDYLDQELLLLYPWHFETPHKYTVVIDGHHTQWDEDRDDVIFNPDDDKWYKLDGNPARGRVSLIDTEYWMTVDGGLTKYTLDNTEMVYYDWLRTNNTQLWTVPTGRIYGFNMYADLDEIAANIGIRHSNFGWDHGYTLEDCGVDKFVVQTKFDSITDLYETYDINTKCYYNLIEKIESASTRDEAQIFAYVYYQLFTVPYSNELYTLRSGDIAESYDQILAERDFTLYNYYTTILNEQDPDVRKEIIRGVLNDLTDTLSYYISGDNLKYVLSFITTNSNDSLMGYISLIINFFKSWKVHFLDPHSTYLMNDKFNHMIFSGDTIIESKSTVWDVDSVPAKDVVTNMTTKYTAQEKNVRKHKFFDVFDENIHREAEVVETFGHYVDENILGNRVYDGQGEDSDEPFVLDGGPSNMDGPFYIVDGGETGARADSNIIEGGGAGLLDKVAYDNSMTGSRGTRKLVNLPIPQDQDSHAVIDGGSVADDLDAAFVLDGGSSDRRVFTTKTVTTKVTEDNHIDMAVRVSPRIHNGISIEEDGLYFKDDFADQATMDRLYNNLKSLMKNSETTRNNLLDTLYAYGTVAGLLVTINRGYLNYFNSFKNIYPKLGSPEYMESFENRINQQVEDYKNWFNTINPFNNFTDVELADFEGGDEDDFHTVFENGESDYSEPDMNEPVTVYDYGNM